MKKLFSQLGFTLIELLVVISVIGVLAVAVLSSINPIEQINKGRDTRTRSDAAQLINAIDRYYATQELYPWNDPTYACGTGNGGSCTTDGTTSLAFPADAAFATICTAEAGAPGLAFCKVDNTGGNWMDALTGTQEVKTGFVARIRAEGDKVGGYAIYVYKDAGGTGSNDTLYACFKPSSEAFKNEVLQICKNTGKGAEVWSSYPPAVQAAACPGTGPNTSNYAATTDELICLP